MGHFSFLLLVCVSVVATLHSGEGASLSSILRSARAELLTSEDEKQDASNERQKRDTLDIVGFLQHYGYLVSPQSKNVFHSEVAVSQAVKDFQQFTGLPVTGQLDQATVDKMMSPRCGHPDMPSGPQGNVTSAQSLLTNPQHFFTLGTRWMKDTVTWKPVQYSRKMPVGQQTEAIQRALKYWSDVTPLKFRQTNGDADIDVMFARGDHGDGYSNRFNGLGGVLAHAFQPGEGIGGDAHFDEDEEWTVGTGQGSDLTTVAAHEFGHSLGLGHSDVRGALMAPYYVYVPDLKLHSDDVRGAQALYGSRDRATEPTTTTTTTTTSTTTTTTTPTTTTTTTEDPSRPYYCGPDFRVDAVAAGEGGTSYLFRDDKVYKVGPWGLEPGYPKYTLEVFPHAPRRHLASAVYLSETRTHYLFKGQNVWRYTDFRLDSGYPRQWLSYEDYFRFRPSATLTFKYGSYTKIFMFGEDTFWEWDPRTETVVPGYPLPTAVYWVGAPHHPEAATSNDDNNFYFFKGNKYYKLHNRVSEGAPQPIGKNWFGLACGATFFQTDPVPAKAESLSSSPSKRLTGNRYADANAATSVHNDDIFSNDRFPEEGLSENNGRMYDGEQNEEPFASLPFELDLKLETSGREIERRYD